MGVEGTWAEQDLILQDLLDLLDRLDRPDRPDQEEVAGCQAGRAEI